MNINNIEDVKKEFLEAQRERDAYRAIAIDEVQFNRNGMGREQAEQKVDAEMFQRLQRGPI